MFSNNLHHHIITTSSTSEEHSTKKQPKTTNDGGDVVRRLRGHSPETKNKTKSSSSSVTRQPNPCMSLYVLEINGGSDIIAVVRQFCNNRRTSLCLLSGLGIVCNVSLKVQIPSEALITAHIFKGCFDLLSISAPVIPSSSPISTMPTPSSTVSGGQMFGGAVVGPLIASGTVYIVAATLSNTNYYRLPMEDDNHIRNNSEYGYVPVPLEPSLGSGGQLHHAPQPPPAAVEPLSMYGDFSYPPTP